jgi:hypothetical protein
VLPIPTVTLSAEPASVQQSQTTTLTWTSQNATECTAVGAWTGSKPLSGSSPTDPLTAASNVFTLLCSGPGGSSSASVEVSATVPPTGRHYSTNFDLNEYPISESGAWRRANNAFTDVRTNGGIAHGTNGAANDYDDSYSLLSGFTADQTAEAVVYVSPNLATSVLHEVELLLRFTDDANGARGYECLFAHHGLIQLVRWNGAKGDFTVLTLNGPSHLGRSFSSGDVVKATIADDRIDIYVNNNLMGTASDSAFASGQPGISFFTRPGGNSANFGLDSFNASSN